MAARPEARKSGISYPESYGELEKSVKDTYEEIVKLNERDQKFHDIAPYCKWRYYKRYLPDDHWNIFKTNQPKYSECFTLVIVFKFGGTIGIRALRMHREAQMGVHNFCL